jgi:ribosome biogenesis GTPase
LTRKFTAEELDQDSLTRAERVSGKGELSRRRTIVAAEGEDQSGGGVLLNVDESTCLRGRVLSVHGLLSTVEAESGALHKCATRRLLKTLSTDQRHVVAAGDRVLFRPSGVDEGIIERIEPRTGTLSRESRGRQHVLVANVDQLLIIGSAAEPYLKPNLIDRFLVAAERERIEPLICINKVDLVDPATLQPLVGVYSQMGYRVLLLSARTGFGIERFRRAMAGRQSVVAGQSGVGKSSLLNAIEPGLALRVASVSEESQKGRHTTTTAQLHRLTSGGYVVDTPGVRQFQLWDLVPEEVAAYYRDIRPFVSHCRYPDCTHAHEEDCAVKDGVADDLIDARRYESYRHLCEGVLE